MTLAKLVDLFFLAACAAVLADAFILVADGYLRDPVILFVLVIVNALWVRSIDGRRQAA